MESKREKAKNKTFTMYPSTFLNLKALAETYKVSNSELLEILINDEILRIERGE
jgi:hypothetical protein